MVEKLILEYIYSKNNTLAFGQLIVKTWEHFLTYHKKLRYSCGILFIYLLCLLLQDGSNPPAPHIVIKPPRTVRFAYCDTMCRTSTDFKGRVSGATQFRGLARCELSLEHDVDAVDSTTNKIYARAIRDKWMLFRTTEHMVMHLFRWVNIYSVKSLLEITEKANMYVYMWNRLEVRCIAL